MASRCIFTREAVRNHVYPLDDRRVERFNAAIAGRPDLVGDRRSSTLYEGMTGIAENAFINVKGRPHAISADVEVSADPANGVIIAQAGRFAGWSLYMQAGRVHEVYDFGGLQRTTVSSPQALPPGRHTVVCEFTPVGTKPGAAAISRLSVDGRQVAEARIPRTMPHASSGDEGVDVGSDNDSPVTEDYPERRNRFSNAIHRVTVELK